MIQLISMISVVVLAILAIGAYLRHEDGWQGEIAVCFILALVLFITGSAT